MKKIPVKNYVMAIAIMVITLLATYYVSKMFIEERTLDNENNMNYIAQLQPSELNNYIIDNHSDVMLYLTDSETTNKNVDKEIKKILISTNHTKDTIYINLNNVDENFYNDFYSMSLSNQNLTNNNLVFIRDLKVVKIFNLNERNIKNVKEYINKFYEE